jgi:hypothetical protein
MAFPLPSARHRRTAASLLVVLPLAVLASCSGGKDKVAETTTTIEAPTTTTTEPPVAPLTGLPQPDDAKLRRPALMVKIDNTPHGMAVQEGIDKADIVFVEQTEQGTTRLAAVFQSRDAVVGPVRSARTSDVGIAGALDRPMLAYSGANRGVLGQVRRGPLVDVGIDASGVTPIYQRNQRGGSRNLYRYFLPTSAIYAARGAEGGTPPALFRYRTADDAPAGATATGVRVNYGGGVATAVSYQWNGTGWARTQNGRATVMAGGGPRIAPANVVVLATPYRNSGFKDVTGAASPQAVLEGSGTAWFLAAGKVVTGRWSRPGPVGAFTFTGGDGLDALLTPGQTFVELAPSTRAVSVLLPASPPTTSS